MSFWKNNIKIGAKEFPRFIGGPMDGVTDSPFRKLVREFSKDELLYTEMRHTSCIAHDKGVTRSLDFGQDERPLNFQLTTNSIDHIKPAIEKALAIGIDAVDLNIGCPAKNVVKSGSGSLLMSDVPFLEKILKEFRRNLQIPFTVKMRAGFKHKNAIEVAKLVQDCGADALTIHPRLQTERFAGVPDYDLAALVKKTLNIPIIFSGEIVDWSSAKRTYEQTGADGFMVSRGLYGAPWRLKELKLKSLDEPFVVDNKLILFCAIKHLENLLDYFGEHGIYCFRKHLPHYIKGIPGAAQLRKKLIVSDSVAEVKEGLLSFLG
ncbi:tRNA-dihydrouridine synthase [bacterium]|jgi:tRNA-dihydrouridine synthase B|nr:tRNA-dihydrouridine synthase [bacterium]